MKEKICSKCGKIKVISEFYKDATKKIGVRSSCKKCASNKDKERYYKQKGSYLYVIKVDGEVWWVGSCSNVRKRITNHRNNKCNGHFKYMCKQKNINLDDKNIEVYECDLEQQGINLNNTDLKFYEHMLIRNFKGKGEPLLNTKENSKFVERDRYVDEMILGNLKFEKSQYTIK
ncbi:MAG: hypothetical protein E6971_14420 [Clostridium perfringens]|nr:hypothetical protein [Clostridium perfringens]